MNDEVEGEQDGNESDETSMAADVSTSVVFLVDLSLSFIFGVLSLWFGLTAADHRLIPSLQPTTNASGSLRLLLYIYWALEGYFYSNYTSAAIMFTGI